MKQVNKYQLLQSRQQEEFNKFPIKFAFDDNQFRKAMNELGLDENDTDKVIATGAGGFMKKSDYVAYLELGNKFAKELENAIAEDKIGDGFVRDMFSYELGNHEYGYTGDLTDTFEALGYTIDDINNNPKLKKGLELALEEYSMEMDEEMEM